MLGKLIAIFSLNEASSNFKKVFLNTTGRKEKKISKVKNSNFEIKDGITAELFIPTKKVQAHLIPPSSLTLDSEGKIGIRHINPNNEVIFSDVEIIGDEKELIWVTGLPEEITLITIGQEFVIEGQKVNYTLEVLN